MGDVRQGPVAEIVVVIGNAKLVYHRAAIHYPFRFDPFLAPCYRKPALGEAGIEGATSGAVLQNTYLLLSNAYFATTTCAPQSVRPRVDQ
jgi:hypothetical protein